MSATPASLLMRLRQPSDHDAWERFVQLYTPLLFHWASKWEVQPSDAADLVQEVFVNLLQSLPTFEYDSHRSFRAWLHTVVRNKWLDLRRRRGQVPANDNGLSGVAASGPLADFDEAEFRSLLLQRGWQPALGMGNSPIRQAVRNFGTPTPANCCSAFFPETPSHVNSLSFTADLGGLAWAGLEGTIHVWDVSEPHERWKRPTRDNAYLAFRPESVELAIAESTQRGDEKARLFLVDGRDGSALRELPIDMAAVGLMRYSRDGRVLIVSGARDRVKPSVELELWDADSGRKLRTYRGLSTVMGMTLSHDGERLFGVLHDGIVVVWDVETGEQILTLRDARHQLYALELTPDGMLVAAGFEGILYSWDGRPLD